MNFQKYFKFQKSFKFQKGIIATFDDRIETTATPLPVSGEANVVIRDWVDD